MRTSRSSHYRLSILCALIWGLSGCFSAPEPPPTFADEPEGDAQASAEEDSGERPEGDITEGSDQEVSTEADTSAPLADTAEASEDTESDASAPESSDIGPESDAPEAEDAGDSEESAPALCGGELAPPNTCVAWICSGTLWKEGTQVADGTPCESECYGGELSCQAGECLPLEGAGGTELCGAMPSDNPCMRPACDHDRSTCTESEPDPFVECDDGDPCTYPDTCTEEGTCEGAAPECPGDDTLECTSGASCNPETGECEHDIAEGFCVLKVPGEEGAEACYVQNQKAPNNDCLVVQSRTVKSRGRPSPRERPAMTATHARVKTHARRSLAYRRRASRARCSSIAHAMMTMSPPRTTSAAPRAYVRAPPWPARRTNAPSITPTG